MKVAVLGGGFQGCCAAIVLASRGVECTIFDQDREILNRAASANEGKIHLGYMYASDPTNAYQLAYAEHLRLIESWLAGLVGRRCMFPPIHHQRAG
jgi:glycine/D-amino acid oxidase-like deaminating enzyme